MDHQIMKITPPSCGKHFIALLCLIISYNKRIVALLSGILLLMFALSMLFFVNIKAPFDYSMFTAAACAFLLYKQEANQTLLESDGVSVEEKQRV